MSKPGTAAVLSFFIPGVGQIYNGAIWRGIFWLIITPGFWIGTGGMLSTIEPSDGIVPVASALHPNAASTTYIAAKHERVHRQAETVRQMQAILAQHFEECAVGAEAKRIELNRRPQ